LAPEIRLDGAQYARLVVDHQHASTRKVARDRHLTGWAAMEDACGGSCASQACQRRTVAGGDPSWGNSF
jgi:hypothetical protein